jgi:hypothetical protein
MNQIRSQLWYGLYETAILAPDQQLVESINVAEAAIKGRSRDLQYDSDHKEERQSIENAQRALKYLRHSVSRH